MFADKEFHEKLTELGADFIGDEKLLKEMGEGIINIDKIIATPEHMGSLKGLARILGPKGLMPNQKSGTLCKADDLLETVKVSKQGLIEYRVNDNAFIMNKFGKRTFTDENLKTNLESLLTTIAKRKPESVKGRFLQKAMVKTSMGPTFKLDLAPYKDY